MPCICYGAVSGKEEFDRIKQTDPDRWNKIHKNLTEAALLVNQTRIHEECFRHAWQKIWLECFEHLLLGCPEKH